MDQHEFKSLGLAWAKIYPDAKLRKLCTGTATIKASECIFALANDVEQYYSVEHNKLFAEVLTEWREWFTKTALEYAIENKADLISFPIAGEPKYQRAISTRFVKLPTEYTHIESNRPFIEVLHEWDLNREQPKKEESQMLKGYDSLPKSWAWDIDPKDAIECVFINCDTTKMYSYNVLTKCDGLKCFKYISETKPIITTMTIDELNDIYHEVGKDFRLRDNLHPVIYCTVDYPTNEDLSNFDYSIDRGVTWIKCQK